MEVLENIDTFVSLSNKKLGDLKTTLKLHYATYMSNKFDDITEEDISKINELRDLFDDMALELQIIIDTIQGEDTNDETVVVDA
jgi:hypothetical protein